MLLPPVPPYSFLPFFPFLFLFPFLSPFLSPLPFLASSPPWPAAFPPSPAAFPPWPAVSVAVYGMNWMRSFRVFVHFERVYLIIHEDFK